MRYYTHKEYYESPQQSLFAATKGHPFGRLTVKAGEELKRRVPEASVFIFIISGTIQVVTNSARPREVSAGTMSLLPKFACTYGVALTDCDFFIVKIPDGFDEEDRPYVRSLPEELPEDFVYDFNTLPTCPIIDAYIRLLLMAVDTGGIIAPEFLDVKRRELFYYLKTCYTRAEVAAFLYPLIGGNSQSFKDLILSNFVRFNTVQDFARDTGLSLSTFNRKFKAAFGVPAYKWMDERKSEVVYKDIVTTEMTFSEIAYKHGFSSSAYLVSFCRRHFGKLPGEIRKNTLSGGGERYLTIVLINSCMSCILAVTTGSLS